MGFPYHPNHNQHGDECYGDGGRVVHAVRGLVSFVALVVAIVERVSAHSFCLGVFSCWLSSLRRVVCPSNALRSSGCGLSRHKPLRFLFHDPRPLADGDGQTLSATY